MKKIFAIIMVIAFGACTSQRNLSEERIIIKTTPELINTIIEIEFNTGKHFNHPSFVFWTEDLEGNYLETLFVTRSVGTGIFSHGEIEPGKWDNVPGEVRRPASLPYWAHKRNVKAEDGLYIPSPKTAIPDALSGATPLGNFLLEAGSRITGTQKVRILFEINQPWDSNDFWTNNKFPDDSNYKSSLQPALVYAVTIDPNSSAKEYFLNPIGHSNPSGKTGELFTDLTTLTTAKEIVQKLSVRIK